MRVSSLLLAVGLAAGVACSAKAPSAPSGGSATVTSLQITVDRSTLDVGTMASLGATGVAEDGTTYSFTSGLTWTTSNNAVLDVRSDGAVMPVSAGEATITLKWRDLVSTKTFAVEQSRSGVFVWGKVSEYLSGLPVPGVTVQRMPMQDGATSDAFGNYGIWLDRWNDVPLSANGRPLGVFWTASGLRGDVLWDASDRCAARYGIVIDSQTLTPIAGATVRFGDAFSATTDWSGWYRIDLGCPTSVQAINAVITKDGYRTYERVVADYGYPIRVSRFDFSLGR